MSGSDIRGVPVSTSDPVCLDLLERALEAVNAFHGDPVALIDEALAHDPRFVMGHVFKAALLTQAMETRIYADMVRHLEAAEALAAGANDRERGHIAAIRAWVEGDFHGAVQLWEAVANAHPFDLLAVMLVHLSGVLLGDMPNQRDCLARVFPLWDESVPGYEFILGFYSFGLEEMRDFSRAEELGRQAIALRPNHPYAFHAVAHVMEMRGRQLGGVQFMNDRREMWEVSNFSNHLWWHLSLFHLDLDRIDMTLKIYDHHLRGSGHEGEKYEELDCAALLWRLGLLGVDVGRRWQDLAVKWQPAATDTLYAFNDVHAMMAFTGAGRADLQHTLLTANERFVANADDANVAMSREIGLPFCHAMQDFAAERYADCVARLMPVRYLTHRLGGSHAQRDVIAWTLLEAALRAGNGDLALALANERCQQKPTSPQNWKFVARAHGLRGDKDRARRAEAKVEELRVA